MKYTHKLSLSLCSLTLCMGLVSCQSTHSVAQTSPASKTSVNQPNNAINHQHTAAAIGNVAIPKAPWTNAAIHKNETDSVYIKEWAKSESKSLCPILALPKQAAAHLSGHSIRRANFSGGWGVAYDLPDLRSAYGVANAGTINPEEVNYSWPYNVNYQDGSMVGYGHEGGNPSAKWLAYVVTPHNGCFYNVWSAQSKAHLEQMIADLRLVNY